MWGALERAPLRLAATGRRTVVLGLDWAGALALAHAFGAEPDVAADLLAAGEEGLLAGIRDQESEDA